MVPLMLEYGSVFFFGLIIGSFLTVCIHRVPQDLSIVFPRSACVHCKQTICWYDNIPVVSFLLLRGRCRQCHASIPPRYPIIELSNGLGYMAILWRFEWGWESVIYAVIFSALLAITWIDWDHQIIPDVISLPGIVLGIVAASTVLPTGFVNSMIGVLVGGGILLGIAWISPYLFGKEGIGGGDIKLLAMVGAFLGWKAALLTLMVASIVGSMIGVILLAFKVLQRGQYIPFGPYLSLGAVLTLFFGTDMLNWYFGRFL
ncbi:MAG: type 4 prepilin-like proteins leader peptide-processing enzyme [Nitrospirales bacterium]|nr:MAG: type 4 prepilin-like proteins leader peptide-processing enzyme [Nitrospirales bacterium]